MSHSSLPDRHRLYELLETRRTDLLALPGDELIRRQVSRDRAYELTGILMPNIRALDARIGAELHPDRAAERRQQIDRLEERAQVYYAADLAAEQTYSNPARQRRLQLAEVVKKHDRTLFNWAVAALGDDPVVARELDDIRSGRGQRDDAEDTLRLVALLREHWAQVDGQIALTRDQLDQAAEDATELLDLLRPNHPNPARDLAQRAYSVWHRDYWELCMLGRYLEREDATRAAQRFPGIRSAPNTTPANPDAVGDTEPEPEESTDTGAPARSTVAAE